MTAPRQTDLEYTERHALHYLISCEYSRNILVSRPSPRPTHNMNKDAAPGESSRAAKRALWEVRQRYSIDPPPRHPHSHRAASPEPKPPQRPTRRRPRRIGRVIKRVALLLILLGLLAGGIFGYKVLVAGNKISVTEKSLLGQIKDLLFSQGETLAGEREDRLNILLIAIGGEGHKGEDLADTIMLVSIRPSDNAVALLSIPRDLYVQVPGEQYFSKINAVHAYGESKRKNGGPELLRQKVEEITGLPIHYYARVDFTAFKHIVDAVGGVNITIEKSFEDYWHKITFPAGTEKMNGERALAYVRARYIEGPEGGDFKRAARQQQVLLALREKIFSLQTAVDFSTVNSILNSLADNIRTDLELWEMKRFFEMARLIDPNQVKSAVLTTGPDGVLAGGTEVLGGVPASVLRPRTGDYSEIQRIAQSIFDTAPAAPAPSQAEPTPSESEPTPAPALPTLEIRNGTNVTGLAKKTADRLQATGYEVVTIGNAKDRATDQTTIFVLNDDFTEQAKSLAEELDAATDSGLPGDEASSEADLLVILGADAGT